MTILMQKMQNPQITLLKKMHTTAQNDATYFINSAGNLVIVNFGLLNFCETVRIFKAHCESNDGAKRRIIKSMSKLI